MTTQNQKLLAAFNRGQTVTESLAARKFGVQNLRARIHELREAGNSIYNNGGSYRLGAPSKAIVAAGYRALGGSAFGR